MIESWVCGFKPDADKLFDVLLSEMDNDMLDEIARADYGQDFDKHLAPIRLFRDKRVIPRLDWWPSEVLELIRWSEPDERDWKPGSTGTRGHLLRAFSCALLLRSYVEPVNHQECGWLSLNETAIQLAESLRVLGGEKHSAGVRFFAWCVINLAPLDAEGIERPFLGLALLCLAVDDQFSTDQDLISLCA